MRILLTGGSGFLGINLIRFLLNKRLKDIVSLDISPFNYPEKNQITHILGDIRDKKLITQIFNDNKFDIVIHAAAALPLYSAKDIISTEVEGTKNLLEASLKNKIKRFIFISSTAVYGIPKKHPVLESDPLIGVGPYGVAKIQAEKLCQEYRKKGLIVTTLRPKSFIGPERLGVFALLYDWARTGHNFPILGSGNNRYQFLDVEDLSRAIYLIITSPKKLNDNYNIGTEIFTTIKQDFQVVLDKAGFNKNIIPLPITPVIFILKILEKLNLSPLYPWIYETVGQDSWVDTSEIKSAINFTPRFSNQESLIRNYNWYINNLAKITDSSGVTHRVPWKQGALSLAKLFF